MAEIRWDIKRGADIYHAVLDIRVKFWISAGKIKPDEVVVWRSGFSGWRRPEELEELLPYFKRWEKKQSKKKKRKREKPKTETPIQKTQIKNILVIDDEKDLRELLYDTLNSHGYKVVCTSSRKEAIKSIKTNLPDAVFLDLKLSDGDGMRVLPRVKELSPNTVVNIISAYGSEETKEKAMKLGAHKFLDKPFNEQDILNSIKVP